MPTEIWHIDVAEIETIDNEVFYIQIVYDNFSLYVVASAQTVITHILTIGLRFPAPSFGEVEMAKLVINQRALKAKQISALDALPHWEKAKCQSLAISK